MSDVKSPSSDKGKSVSDPTPPATAAGGPRRVNVGDALIMMGVGTLTIWLSIIVVSDGLLGCMPTFILWTIDATTG